LISKKSFQRQLYNGWARYLSMKKIISYSLALSLLCASFFVDAQQYLTVEQAQKAIFENAQSFKQTPVTLSSEQISKIKSAASTGTPIPDKRIWQVLEADKPVGWFIIDEVYGKHEFITYAIGINLDGTVRMIDIMDYRETYGYQVREAGWRGQFVGKNSSATFKLNKGIDNISGATLSCKHLADGVKRVLTLYDVVLKSHH
jgi:Na+-transporting NADH:ubiquinone oxidoreductase subunit C